MRLNMHHDHPELTSVTSVHGSRGGVGGWSRLTRDDHIHIPYISYYPISYDPISYYSIWLLSTHPDVFSTPGVKGPLYRSLRHTRSVAPLALQDLNLISVLVSHQSIWLTGYEDCISTDPYEGPACARPQESRCRVYLRYLRDNGFSDGFSILPFYIYFDYNSTGITDPLTQSTYFSKTARWRQRRPFKIGVWLNERGGVRRWNWWSTRTDRIWSASVTGCVR